MKWVPKGWGWKQVPGNFGRYPLHLRKPPLYGAAPLGVLHEALPTKEKSNLRTTYLMKCNIYKRGNILYDMSNFIKFEFEFTYRLSCCCIFESEKVLAPLRATNMLCFPLHGSYNGHNQEFCKLIEIKTLNFPNIPRIN